MAYQGILEVIQFITGKYTFPQPTFVIIDFVADQVQLILFFSTTIVRMENETFNLMR